MYNVVGDGEVGHSEHVDIVNVGFEERAVRVEVHVGDRADEEGDGEEQRVADRECLQEKRHGAGAAIATQNVDGEYVASNAE